MLVALLVPIAFAVTSLAIAFLVGGLQPIQRTFLLPLALLPALLVYMLIFTGLAEEIGWRGYALPELQRRHSAERASWILGIAWGLWHLPSNLLPLYLRGELTLGLAAVILLGLTIGIVGWTIVLTWFYNNTESVSGSSSSTAGSAPSIPTFCSRQATSPHSRSSYCCRGSWRCTC